MVNPTTTMAKNYEYVTLALVGGRVAVVVVDEEADDFGTTVDRGHADGPLVD